MGLCFDFYTVKAIFETAFYILASALILKIFKDMYL